MYGPVPLIAVWVMLLSLAWAVSQSLSWMLFDENAIFDRKATSGAQRSISTVSRSTALIWLKMPEYFALLAPLVYFGGFAQSMAVSGYDLPAYAASLAAADPLAAGALDSAAL